jgi:hypothetical protein
MLNSTSILKIVVAVATPDLVMTGLEQIFDTAIGGTLIKHFKQKQRFRK